MYALVLCAHSDRQAVIKLCFLSIKLHFLFEDIHLSFHHTVDSIWMTYLEIYLEKAKAGF